MGLHHPSDPTLTAPWAGDTLGTWNMNSSYLTGHLVHHGQGATPKSMDIVDVQLESASLTTPSPSQPACHCRNLRVPSLKPLQGTPAQTAPCQKAPAHEFQMFQDHLATLRVGGDGISWQIK